MGVTRFRGPVLGELPGIKPTGYVPYIPALASGAYGFIRGYTKVYTFTANAATPGVSSGVPLSLDVPTTSGATTLNPLELSGIAQASRAPVCGISSDLLTIGTTASTPAQNDWVGLQASWPSIYTSKAPAVDYVFTEIVLNQPTATNNTLTCKWVFGILGGSPSAFNTLEGANACAEYVGFSYIAAGTEATTLGLNGVGTAAAGTLASGVQSTTPYTAAGHTIGSETGTYRLSVLLKPTSVADAAGGVAYFWVNRKHVGTISDAGKIPVGGGTLKPALWLKTEATGTIARTLQVHSLSVAVIPKERNSDGTAYVGI